MSVEWKKLRYKFFLYYQQINFAIILEQNKVSFGIQGNMARPLINYHFTPGYTGSEYI